MKVEYYPLPTRQIWDANAKERWLEASGPLYHDTEVKVLKHYDGMSLVLELDGEDYTKIDPEMVSYASWLILRASEPDDTVIVKIRIDDVAARRPAGKRRG